jgi:hypothetical protein
VAGIHGKYLKILAKHLDSANLTKESKEVSNLMSDYIGHAKSSKEKKEISSPEGVYNLLKETPKPNIYLDNPMGSKKGFGNKKRKLPFDYGEFSNWINPADGMGWDIIIPPSNRKQTNLVQVGIVKVNPDKKTWKEKANKKPPVGNDKIIVASDGEITEEDKSIIEDFFSDMWQFKEVIWFDADKEAVDFAKDKGDKKRKGITFFRTNLDYGERGRLTQKSRKGKK